MKVFKYIEELDCFVVRKEFVNAIEKFGLSEWTPVVWICRYLTLDDDSGEHLFDNWDERKKVVKLAKEKGIDIKANGWDEEKIGDSGQFAIIINPKKFSCDSPCHSDDMRKWFWTNVLKSMEMDWMFILKESVYAKNE